ncbi:MAG: transketolase [Firmicutes bacterium]|nr:transketolase [Bacillota bacterium]
MGTTEIKQKTITAIRVTAAEAVERAKSGHPGLPLGAAAIGYELYANHLNADPRDPAYINRDRFVLSAGHGTMLMYGLLHLFGYDVSMEDIKNFRQLGSKTPGHPELGVTPGVDISTGPLGQGIANAVGFAMAETMLANRFNRENFKVFDNYTYAFCGEGCLMEGIQYEAASLAGTLKLGKLIVLYDCNKITIEGDSDVAFDEDVAARHRAQGWQTLYVEDGNDPLAIGRAIKKAKAEKNKPSFIAIRTRIGFGSAKEGLAASHGAPLGEANVKLLKEKLGWDYPDFTVPDEVYAHCREKFERGVKARKKWDKMMREYAVAHPELYKEFKAAAEGRHNVDFDAMYALFDSGAVATRKASHIILNRIAKECPEFVGGSADLGPSNLTVMDGAGDYSKDDRAGHNLHFGIREHAMAAICNGLAAYGGVKPFCATFFSFSDYMKNAIRMSAIMELPVIYVLTHDSIGVGEDGPTHQPIEHLAGLRAMPHLRVFRPADGKETVAAYEAVFSSRYPTAIVASRQDLPLLKNTGRGALKGGYVVYDVPNFKAIILAAGSEVSISVAAAEALGHEGVAVRVVSMPCFSLFEQQSAEYKESVLPCKVRARVAVEAGASQPWGRYVGLDGEYVCIDRFGESSKPEMLFEKYGITAGNVIEKVKKVLY